ILVIQGTYPSSQNVSQVSPFWISACLKIVPCIDGPSCQLKLCLRRAGDFFLDYNRRDWMAFHFSGYRCCLDWHCLCAAETMLIFGKLFLELTFGNCLIRLN